jgi:hypothetical protein
VLLAFGEPTDRTRLETNQGLDKYFSPSEFTHFLSKSYRTLDDWTDRRVGGQNDIGYLLHSDEGQETQNRTATKTL